MLTVFAARLLHSAYANSFTIDEPHYVGTALYLWKTGDYDFYRVLRAHPPLAFHLAGLPLLALDLQDRVPTPEFGGELIAGPDPSPDLVRVLSRTPFILLACWGGLLLFLWAREAAGTGAAFLAVFLYTFSPTVLANAPLAHSDITVTVFYLQTLYCLWRWLARPTVTRFCLCGLSLGLALISKLSGLLLLPTIALILIARSLQRVLVTRMPVRERLARFVRQGLGDSAVMVAFLGIATGVFWAGYGGSFAASKAASGPLAGWPLPGYFHSLFLDMFVNARGGRTVFLLGRYSDHGWWYFFPVAFVLKTPPAVLFLLLMAACRRRAGGTGMVVGMALLVYALVACFWLRVPLGFRYVLPMIPLLHLWSATRLAPPGRGWQQVAVPVGSVWLAIASMAVHPHYLAYFSELVGGPKHGYKYLVDSNLDWGQSLGALAKYLRERGNPPIWLAYFGPERPERYGIRARRLQGCKPVKGIIAISASVLRGVAAATPGVVPRPRGCYAWLLAHEPIAQPGYSILVYEIPALQQRGDG